MIQKGQNIMNRVLPCIKCENIKLYDYGKKIYYCDHKDREDYMGKLAVDKLPEVNPIWCPKMQH